MTGWSDASPDDIENGHRVSTAVSINEFIVERTSAVQPRFLHAYSTSSKIDPEVTRTTNIRSNHISNAPLGTPFPIHFSIRFWNTFQNTAQKWAGFRIKHSTELANYKLVPTGQAGTRVEHKLRIRERGGPSIGLDGQGEGAMVASPESKLGLALLDSSQSAARPHPPGTLGMVTVGM